MTYFGNLFQMLLETRKKAHPSGRTAVTSDRQLHYTNFVKNFQFFFSYFLNHLQLKVKKRIH